MIYCLHWRWQVGDLRTAGLLQSTEVGADIPFGKELLVTSMLPQCPDCAGAKAVGTLDFVLGVLSRAAG
ncbi:MAG: hypothetical protein U0984_00860 [Prosthecobacter sp.]|nr:hypothetical protein [Prosthecobacter sp.]